MARQADELKRDIVQTRDELGSTLEAIGDRVAPRKVAGRVKENVADKVDDVKERVSPRGVVRRRSEGMRQRLSGLREAVMGSDDGDHQELEVTGPRSRPTTRAGARAGARAGTAASSVRDQAGSLKDQAGSVPRSIQRSAQGNPLAAGVVAFGGGFLLASALRPTEPERRATERAKSRLEPVRQQAIEAGRSVAEDLKGVAQEGLGEVKQRASEAAVQLKEEAASTVDQVKQEARSSAEEVKEEATGASEQVKSQAKSASRHVKAEAEDAAAVATNKPRTRRGARTGAGSSTPTSRRSGRVPVG